MEEIAAVQATEKELAKMSRLEMEYITRLRRKQAEQRDAYMELEVRGRGGGDFPLCVSWPLFLRPVQMAC